MATMFLAHLLRVRASPTSNRTDRPTDDASREIRPARPRALASRETRPARRRTDDDRPIERDGRNERDRDRSRTNAHAHARTRVRVSRTIERTNDCEFRIRSSRVVVEGNDRGVLSVRGYNTYILSYSNVVLC
jgi:hypothetical protein